LQKFFFILSFTLLFFKTGFTQVEMAEITNPVYDYLKRMQLMKIVPEYNSADIPLPRNTIAGYLTLIRQKSISLTSTDKKILTDLETEFEYELTGSIKNNPGLFAKNGFRNIFNNNKITHLYSYEDSGRTFFADLTGYLSQRGSSGDSLGGRSLLIANLGLKARGTFFDNVGYYFKISNGQVASGNDSDIIFGSATDIILQTDKDLVTKRNFNYFEGYVRYQTKANWLALTFGRTPLNFGFGYIDKLFLSNNTIPFDFGKLDIRYKALQYTFAYGSLNGDSIFKPLSSKNIATHNININFSESFKLGLWESVIISEQPFSFTYLNPLSFLTSADLSIGKEQTTENNSLIGIDMEVIPFRNFSFQTSLLIDDLTFGTLGKDDSLNENKFGWQFGALWTNSFNMSFALEFTHLDPFVYSHRSNKSTYTNHSLSLGHALPPNSDEIAAKINFDLTNRLKFSLLFQHQRSGEGVVIDSKGKLIANYGGNINFGLGDAYLRTNNFLDGTRINRDILTLNLYWQPIRKLYIEGKYQYRIQKIVSDNVSFKDSFYFANLKIDL